MTDTAPGLTTLPPLASQRAHASCPCPNDVPWGLWGSVNPVLVLTKFCTTYPLARIRAWTFQPLEQNFLNWQLQNCGVFLHWSFANAISSMFCMYDLINPWIMIGNTGLLESLGNHLLGYAFVCLPVKPWVVGCSFPTHVFVVGGTERSLYGEKMEEPANRGGIEWRSVWDLANVGETHVMSTQGRVSASRARALGRRCRCWNPSWQPGKVETDDMTLRSFLEPKLILLTVHVRSSFKNFLFYCLEELFFF